MKKISLAISLLIIISIFTIMSFAESDIKTDDLITNENAIEIFDSQENTNVSNNSISSIVDDIIISIPSIVTIGSIVFFGIFTLF